jgi:hypothetical protein
MTIIRQSCDNRRKTILMKPGKLPLPLEIVRNMKIRVGQRAGLGAEAGQFDSLTDALQAPYASNLR